MYLNNLFISDDEVVSSSHYNYLLSDCKNDLNTKKRTQTLDQCLKQTKQDIINERHVDNKEEIIRALSRGILFLILMVTHLPAFLKTRKE
ncbi:MAG: hypothetical protein GXP45_05515 [bacterium]|nr:hypothetical protein [bacterium]